MPPYNDVLNGHVQLYPDSCAGWGLEFILKFEEKIKMHEYPIQTNWPNGCGFGGDEKKILSDLGIIASDDSFELAAFEAKTTQELAASRTVIFTAPDHLSVNQVTGEITIMTHTWAAVPTGHGHEYRSRAFGQIAPLSPLPLAGLYAHLRKALMPDWKIHALWYIKA